MVNLKQIIDILKLDDHYGISNEIDTAKGMYKIPKRWKDVVKIIKRKLKQNG